MRCLQHFALAVIFYVDGKLKIQIIHIVINILFQVFLSITMMLAFMIAQSSAFNVELDIFLKLMPQPPL
ncbi:MAG: hypothetical protein JXK07_07470 [Spirochaetes bacterium]|nr:hypothetical protein [Spirochaetota bacterium]MBN2769693.1 hypothetical protein [Spirochaetota bacterium]